MKKITLSAVAASLLFASTAFAQTSSTTPVIQRPVIFPIAELGSCGSKQECKEYCEAPAHKEACVAYGETHGLMNKERAAAARMIIRKLGPGGCTTALECRAYCGDHTHKEACFIFAVKNGLRSQIQANNVLERIRAKIGSSTDMRKDWGSSTRPLPPGIEKTRLMNASGTPSQFNKPIPPGIMKTRPASTTNATPSSYVPRTGLGAAVANFLEFIGW